MVSIRKSIVFGSVLVLAAIVFLARDQKMRMPEQREFAIISRVDAVQSSGTNLKPVSLAAKKDSEFAKPIQPSEALRQLLAVPRRSDPPTISLMRELKISDKVDLLRYFESETLSNKVVFSWALAYLGGDDVRDAFIKNLEMDYHAKSMQIPEWLAFGSMLYGMGLMASSSDTAYSYLLERVDPEQWKKLRTWIPANRGEDSDLRLSGFAVQALGMSGRQEVLRVLDSLIQRDGPEIKGLWGEFVEAQYYLTRYRELGGRDAFLEMIHGGEGAFEDYKKWTETLEGQHWKQWGESIRSRQ